MRGTGRWGHDIKRVFAVVLPLDLFFSALSAIAFLRLMKLSVRADGVWVALSIPFLLKLFTLLSCLLVMMRPIVRWRREEGRSRDAAAPAAWLATEHGPGRFSFAYAAAWGASYLVTGALIGVRGLGGADRIPSLVVFAVGLWCGAFQLSYTVVWTLLANAKRTLSIEACRRDTTLPSARTRLWRRLALTTLAVGITPNLLVGSVALALALQAGGTTWHGRDVMTVLFLLLCSLLWVPFAAWFQSRVVAVPLSQVSDTIRRIANESAQSTELPAVPILSDDELGDVATSFNQMTGRLSQTLTALHEQRAEQHRLLDDADAKRRLFEAILTHTPVGLALCDVPDYRFRFINAAYQQFAPGRNLLGRAFADALPEFAPHAAGTFAEVMRTGAAVRFADEPFLLPRVDAPGGVVEIFITVQAVPVYRNDTIESVLLVVEDTTERVRAQQRADAMATIAHRHAAGLQLVLDNMADGVIVCDAAGRVTMANRAGTQTLGVGSVDALDIDALATRVAPVERGTERPLSAAERPLRRALAGETLTELSIVLQRGQGGLPRELRVSASPLRDAEGRIVGAVSVFRDVTELIELDRLKDQFIRAAAHELKTPVTIMKVRAQTLLRTDEPDVAARRRGLEAIDRGADRITQIVRDLLELSESQLGRLRLAPRRADLVPLLDLAIEQARRRTAKHNITRTGEPSAICDVDPSRIAGVVERLLDNAVKYSPAGGDIGVSVRRQDGAVVVAVTDHGVGLSPAQGRRLFECFYRAHAETSHDFGGLGVGLFLARQIIQLHEGEIGFESNEGRGSTFWFRLKSAAPT